MYHCFYCWRYFTRFKNWILVGATPYRQQYGELLGVVTSALTIGFTLTLLNQAWGFGSEQLPAPQATLMKLVIEGVMRNDLPWMFVFTGVGLGVAIEFFKTACTSNCHRFILTYTFNDTNHGW